MGKSKVEEKTLERMVVAYELLYRIKGEEIKLISPYRQVFQKIERIMNKDWTSDKKVGALCFLLEEFNRPTEISNEQESRLNREIGELKNKV